MALVECKECGGKVSTIANSCPHCGAVYNFSATATEDEGQIITTSIDLKFTCPNCNTELTADTSHCGQEFECPDCGSNVTVPRNPNVRIEVNPFQGSTNNPPPPSPPAKSSPPPSTQPDGRIKSLRLKSCHACGSEISIEAKSCQNCGAPTPKSMVRGPAIAMLILSIFYLFGLGYHVGKSSWWRTDVPAPRTSQYIAEQTTSMVLGATAPVAHLFIILGSIFMLRLERIGWAKTAAILSAIPILSHCLIVGIPFGYWALSVLRKPEVKLLFAYHQVDKKNLNTNIAPSLALVSMLVCFVPGFLIGDLRWDSLRNSNKKSDTEPEPATRWPARAVPEEESMED